MTPPAAKLELEFDNVFIEGFTDSGLRVTKGALGIVSVRRSTFSRGPTGIILQSMVPNVVASISDSDFNNLTSFGIRADTNSYAAVSNSVFSTINGSAVSVGAATVYAKGNMISNTSIGLNATIAGSKIAAIDNTIVDNTIVGNSKSLRSNSPLGRRQ
jgi:hypothetical protein